MKEQDMNRKLNQAFAKVTPDVLDSVVKDCNWEKEKVTTMKTRKNPWIGRIAAAAACLLVVLSGMGGYVYSNNYAEAATATLDVNPSVEICMNKKERVLDVKPLNEDGAAILEGMDFEDTDLEVTVNALVGSMLKHGYISELQNSILISVEGKNEEKSQALQHKISRGIEDMLQQEGIQGAVLSQVVSGKGDQAAKELAEKHDISLGKAQLVDNLAAVSGRYTADELAGLTVNELNLLMQKAENKPQEMQSVGAPSQKSYIDAEAAVAAAMKHLGLFASMVVEQDCELEAVRGVMMYEVELTTAEQEYEILVDSESGAVIHIKVEAAEADDKDDVKPDDKDDDKDDKDEIPENGAYISRERAKGIVLQAMGLDRSQVKDLKAKLDMDDGKVCFEVEYELDGKEYEFKLDAATGEVLDRDADPDKDDKDDRDDKISIEGAISEERIKELVLGALNMAENQVKDLDIDLDMEDGKLNYDVKLQVGDRKFELKLDAVTGQILDRDEETEKPDDKDDKDDEKDILDKLPGFSREKARELVLKALGIAEDQAGKIDLDLDMEDGRMVAKAEVRVGDQQFEVKLDLQSGALLEKKAETKD